MVEIRGCGGLRRIEVGPIRFDEPKEVVRLHLADHDELRCHLGLLPVYADGRLAGELNIRPGKLTEHGWQVLRLELNRLWTGLILDPGSSTSVAATGLDPVSIWRRIAPVVADLQQAPVTTLGATERWIRFERVRVPSELTKSVVLSAAKGRPGRGRSLGSVISEPERALVRDFLRRLGAAALQQPKGAPTAAAVNRFLTSGLFATPSRLTPTITHLARHEPRLRQVVAARQELLNAQSLLTEGPGELRLGIRSLDKLYEYWVFLTVLEQIREMVGEPLGAGMAVLKRDLAGRKIRLELPEGTEVRFPGGIRAAYSPTITASGRNSWLGLELAGYHRDSGLRSPSLITPDVIVSRESANGTIRLFVIDAKYRARHKVDPALNEVYLKYSRIRFAGRPVVAAVIAAHPHHDLDVRWPGQWSLPFVPGAEHAPRFLPASWVLRQPESETTLRNDEETESEGEDDDAHRIAEMLDRSFIIDSNSAHRSVEELRRLRGLRESEAHSVYDCIVWCRAQGTVSWRKIIERTIWKAATWDLEAADNQQNIPLTVLGQVFHAVRAELPSIEIRLQPLAEAVAQVLKATTPPQGMVLEERNGVVHLTRDFLSYAAGKVTTPAQLLSEHNGLTSVRRDTEPDLILCDQQWMATERRGEIIDLSALREHFAAHGCVSILLATADGRAASFQAAAVARGWLAFDDIDRTEMLERCRTILRYIAPRCVTVLSANQDMIDLASEYADEVTVEKSLLPFRRH